MKKALAIAMLLIVTVPASVGQQDMSVVAASLAHSIEAKGKHRVAVVDFTDLQGNVTELGRYLAEELSVSLFNNAKGFEVIDRTHLKSIIQEHKLSAKGLIDPNTARKLGEIVGADALVTGTLTTLGDSVRLAAKVIDANTAALVAASVVEIPKTKAIDALGGNQVAEIDKPSGSSKQETTGLNNKPVMDSFHNSLPPGATVSAWDNDFLFNLKDCRRLGPSVRCAGSITNKDSTARWFTIRRETYFADEFGNQYSLKRQSVGVDERSKELEPDLPIQFSVEAADLRANAKRLTIVLNYWAGKGGISGQYYKVVLKNAAINDN